MDLERRPELGQRFGVEVTPTTMVIRRDSSARMVIASGVESYPNLAQTTYQAVRLMLGDIRPEQFLTGAGEDRKSVVSGKSVSVRVDLGGRGIIKKKKKKKQKQTNKNAKE